MPPSLTTSVALVALFTGLLWLPYVLNRLAEHGLWRALRNPNPDDRPAAGWAIRLMAAHRNAVENLAVFAPLAILVQTQGLATPLAATAATTYLIARVAHAIVYTLGIPGLRTIAFAVGFVCQLVLGLRLLGLL